MPLSVQVETTGVEQVASLVSRTRTAALRAKHAIVLELAQLGEYVVKERIKAVGALHRRTLLNSIEYYVSGGEDATVEVSGRVFSDLPYAEVVDKGRRPGARMPPPSALHEWVREKIDLAAIIKAHVDRALARRSRARKAAGGKARIKGERGYQKQLSEAQAIRSAAFVIARSIGRKGIKGREFYAAGAKAIRVNARKVAEKVLRGLMGGGS